MAKTLRPPPTQYTQRRSTHPLAIQAHSTTPRKSLKLDPPFEFHSPAKAPKSGEGEFQLDKDRRDRPRRSPVKRKGAIAGSSHLDIVTGESYSPNTDDDEDEGEPPAVPRRSRPLNPIQARYLPRDESPTPSAPKTSRKNVTMNPAPPPTDEESATRTRHDADIAAQQQRDHDLAAQQKRDTDAAAQQQRAADAAAQRQRDADAAAATALVNAAAAAAQALAAQQLAAQQAAAFVMPTMAALMAHIPPSRARNPLPPPVDADLGRARFQHNNGQFRNHVVANDAMTRGIAQTQLEDFLRGPGTKILLPVADGGRQFFQVDFETPVDEQIKLALRTLAPTSEIDVRLPVPANQYTSGTAKYGGPRSILVDIADAAEAAAVVANKTFAVHEGLAFWAHDYLANAATRNWAFAHYSSMVDVPAAVPSYVVEASARAGLVRTAYQNQAAFHKVDMATQARGGPAAHRVFDALNTMHAEFIRYPGKTPVIVMYLEPLTDNAVEMERATTPRSPCHFTNMDPSWWGPPGQLSELPNTNPLITGHGGGGGGGGGGKQRRRWWRQQRRRVTAVVLVAAAAEVAVVAAVLVAAVAAGFGRVGGGGFGRGGRGWRRRFGRGGARGGRGGYGRGY
ncbi:hypothetical protein B0H14DRAFT_3507853 [Mycena olivaceomarginata]|nr:hypothetical protein B0H14DRAFT_3507853 [Mycena olivaceomarginata]